MLQSELDILLLLSGTCLTRIKKIDEPSAFFNTTSKEGALSIKFLLWDICIQGVPK